MKELQQLLNNLIALDPTARVVCSIGNADHSTLEKPMFYLSTRINRMAGFMACSVACHADSPVEVMQKFKELVFTVAANGGKFSYDRQVFTANNDFSQLSFK